MSSSAAHTSQVQLPESGQPSAQQLPIKPAPVAPLQQPVAAQQAAQGDGQAGAQAGQHMAATLTTAQLQAPGLAEQPQTQARKLKRSATSGGPEIGSEAAADEDNNKKKKRKKRKKRSEDVPGATVKDSNFPAADADCLPQAGAQDADQAITNPNAMKDTADAVAFKPGKLFTPMKLDCRLYDD